MKPAYAFDIFEKLNWGPKTLSQSFDTPGAFISLLLKNVFTLAGLILLALLVFGGLTFVIGAGSGDPKKADQAKSTITNSLIGFLIIFVSFFIIQIIEVITGLSIL
ncbi:MAG: hypothetical protein WC596_03415 [Candidatus Shapirobacteria bacterium]